ncbi:hypothetical protein ACFLW3_02350 [Chloroflexota bacterium]
MILIGENINIMSLTIGPALKGRDPEPVQELVRAEVKSGVDYLDINIGPARKAGGCKVYSLARQSTACPNSPDGSHQRLSWGQ